MERQGFVDWMKAFGMLLIVIGHVVGDPENIFNMVTQPLYTKQLGVSMFLFVTGWSLANESRTGARIIYNRIFPIYFYGVVCAVFLSFIFSITKGTINASNYLPFLMGVNVLFDHFPANPSTWYIGTYIHMILFWYFFLRGRQVTIAHLLVAFAIESVARCLLIAAGKDYIAYMLLPNWLTVFLLGVYLKDKRDLSPNISSILIFIVWIAVLLLWASPINGLQFNSNFPFREIVTENGDWLLARSFLISAIYILNTLAVFALFRRLPSSRLAEFFSRNTLIIFIAHMPVLYEISGFTYGFLGSGWLGRLILIVILFVGLALLSEIIQRTVNLNRVRDSIWRTLTKRVVLAT